MAELLEDYRRGVLFLDAGDMVGAARILTDVVAADPGNAGARLSLARALFGSAQLRAAETHLRVLVDRDPTDHYAHHVLGRTLERQSRHAEALPHLRLAAAMADVAEYAEAVVRVQRIMER